MTATWPAAPRAPGTATAEPRHVRAGGGQVRIRPPSGTVVTMSRTRKSPEDVSFPAEVGRQFGPFALRSGMTGPVEDDLVLPTVEWTAGALTYRWSHDPSDGSVSVAVVLAVAGGMWWASLADLAVAGGMWWASLADLVVANRLGVPPGVRRSGLLTRQVESHAGWLRRLHPTLAGPDAEAFMVAGGARFSG